MSSTFGGVWRRATGLEHAPQVGDVDLEGGGGSGGPVVAPQQVDEAVEGDDVVGFQEQHGQHGPLLRTAEIEHPVVVLHLERPEDPVVAQPAPPGRRA